jgi:hypothetical protein
MKTIRECLYCAYTKEYKRDNPKTVRRCRRCASKMPVKEILD